MGSNLSSRNIETVDSPYFCISFQPPDKIRLIRAPGLVGVMRQSVCDSGVGIQEETNYCGSNTFKLKGCPFWSSDLKPVAFTMRKMLCALLEELSRRGFSLVANSNVTRKDNVSSWFFHRENMAASCGRTICLSLSGTDSLTLINSEDHSLLNELITNAIREKYKPGLQNYAEIEGTAIFKLYDCPWHSFVGNSRRHGIWLLLEIFAKIQLNGYDYVGRVDVKGTADSFFFTKSVEKYRTGPLSPLTPRPFVMSLESRDSIQLMGAPEEAITAVRSAIETYYPKPLQNDSYRSDEPFVWDFKISGTPWWANGATEAVNSRYLMLKVLETLCSVGWRISVTMETSHRFWDKSVFVMESRLACAMHFVCLSLNSTDVIRLINGDKLLAEEVRKLIESNWPTGIQEEKVIPTCNGDSAVPEWQLTGHPWGQHPADGIFSRALLCELLAMFERNGWVFVTSADVSAKYHADKNARYPLDVHSWYFAKPVVPGRDVAAASGAANQPTSFLSHVPAPGDAPPSYESASYGHVVGTSEAPPAYDDAFN